MIELTKIIKWNRISIWTGGQKYLDENLFLNNKINLNYLNYKQVDYEQQKSSKFISGLSILDEIMNKDLDVLIDSLK